MLIAASFCSMVTKKQKQQGTERILTSFKDTYRLKCIDSTKRWIITYFKTSYYVKKTIDNIIYVYMIMCDNYIHN